MKKHWRSVVFVDLDNTILKGSFRHAVFSVACREIAAKTGLELEVVRHLVKKENCDRQRHPVFNAVRAMDWDDIVSTIGKRLGVKVETNILEIAQSYTYPPYLQLLDDADKVLRQLSSRPHRAIVAATKGLKKYQMPMLAALKLTSLFTDILTPDRHNVLKQDRSFYGRWPESTQLQIMVGDDYEDDILAPHQFGFKTVWKPNINEDIEIQSIEPLYRPSNGYQKSRFVRPDAIITTLRELPEIVTLMEEQAKTVS